MIRPSRPARSRGAAPTVTASSGLRYPRGRRRWRGWVAVLAVVATGAAVAYGAPYVQDRTAAADHPVSASELSRGRDELAHLPVKGKAPMTGYAREQFGPAWADVDRNGCDTRNDVLARDLTDVTYKPGTHDCVVLTGTLDDPYTGRTIAFARGPRSADVQIDHVVALANAWVTGAQQLSAERRRELANDPANLLAVDGPANQAKGAGDAATWLPPSRSYRCAYALRQIHVKTAYDLWVTKAEQAALDQQLDRCAPR